MALSKDFDVGGDVKWSQGIEFENPCLISPCEESLDGSKVGFSGIGVSNGGNEEFYESLCRGLTAATTCVGIEVLSPRRVGRAGEVTVTSLGIVPRLKSDRAVRKAAHLPFWWGSLGISARTR